MGSQLADPQCAASVSSRRFSVPSSSRRASSTVHITVSMGSSTEQLGLGGQERVVEADVVGDQGAPRSTSIRSGDVAETGWLASISAVRPCTVGRDRRRG